MATVINTNASKITGFRFVTKANQCRQQTIFTKSARKPLAWHGDEWQPGEKQRQSYYSVFEKPCLWAGASLPSRFPHRLKISRPVTPRLPPPIPCDRNNSSSITTLLNQAERDNGCNLHGTFFSVSRSRGKIVIARTACDLSKKVLINAA